jgi:Glycosyl hydrolases family 18
MSPRLRLVVPALLAVAVIVAGVLLSVIGGPFSAGPKASDVASATGGTNGLGGSGGPEGDASPTPAPTPTLRPETGGTELYGFLPYWQMSATMATYLDSVPLSTLALFSVSPRRNGALDTRDLGYRRITGDLGRRLISDAHARRTRVDLVFTSFGEQRNGILFGRLPVPSGPSPSTSPGTSPAPTSGGLSTEGPTPSQAVALAPWHRTVDELVALAVSLGVDGLNVDVELLNELDRYEYGAFLSALRTVLVAAVPGARLSVATEAGLRGTGNAVEAAAAGVDRVFLMGYDYHWSGSQPGASSPVDRADGLYTLRWSIEQYVQAGVPRDRIVLGLPLYGMTWRTLWPGRTAPVLGSGSTWIPNRHLDVLLAPSFQPGRDPLEIAEFFVRPDGDAWRMTFYDSPATLREKLALARDQGLAGGGFWAIGYERGLPGYLELMRDFRAGKVDRSEAPIPEAPVPETPIPVPALPETPMPEAPTP